MSGCSAIDLDEIRRSSKITSWICLINFGMVTVLSRLKRAAPQVETSTRLKCSRQFLMVAYDGACSINVSDKMARISFGVFPCRKKTYVSMLLKSRATLDMLPFSLCNKKRLAIRHMNRHLIPTTLSVPSYNFGK